MVPVGPPYERKKTGGRGSSTLLNASASLGVCFWQWTALG